MHWTIAMVLVGLWMLGVMTPFAMGGFIHVLLVIALIVVLHRTIQDRRLL